jgi:hypothetical protein
MVKTGKRIPKHPYFDKNNRYVGDLPYNEFIRPQDMETQIEEIKNAQLSIEETFDAAYDLIDHSIMPLKDPDQLDVWHLPKDTMEKGEGDCEDNAFPLGSLLEGLNVESSVELGFYKGEGHAFVVATLNNGCHYLLDPAMDKKFIFCSLKELKKQGYELDCSITKDGVAGNCERWIQLRKEGGKKDPCRNF